MNLLKFLDQHNIVYRVYQHTETYDAQHLAQCIHVSGHKIAKAVMVRAADGLNYVLIVPATERVDLPRVSAILGGTSVRLATEREILERCPGYEFGVVPAFGSQFGMQTIVDASISNQIELTFQGETHEEAIRMRFSDYYLLEHPRIATIVLPHETKMLAS